MEDFLNRLKVISKKKKKGGGVLQIIFYILHLRNILSFVSILASVCMNRLKNKLTIYMYSLKRCYVAKKLFCVF